MGTLYKKIESLCKERGVNITTMCTESGASRGSLTDLKMGRKQSLSAATLSKIAAYFNVSVDSLLGNEKKSIPEDEDGLTEKADLSDDDIKFALFGGGPVTDEQFAEVKQFVRFIKERDANGGKR